MFFVFRKRALRSRILAGAFLGGCICRNKLRNDIFGKDTLCYNAEQGVEIERPSLLYVATSLHGGSYDIRVGGKIRLVATGEWNSTRTPLCRRLYENGGLSSSCSKKTTQVFLSFYSSCLMFAFHMIVEKKALTRRPDKGLIVSCAAGYSCIIDHVCRDFYCINHSMEDS